MTAQADAGQDASPARSVPWTSRWLERRLAGLPDDLTLRSHLARIPGSTLHTLLVSEPWDTGSVGGEEVDVEWLLEVAAAAAELT